MFYLQDDGKWLHVKETHEIGESARPVRTAQHGQGGRSAGARRAAEPSLAPHPPLSRPSHSCAPLSAAGEGKLFSPGNLRATFDNPNYQRLIEHYLGEKYTLRYTGGMVGLLACVFLPACLWGVGGWAASHCAPLVAPLSPCPQCLLSQAHSAHTPTPVAASTGARRVPDHREGEGRVHQRDLPLHQGQAAPLLRGRPPGPAGEPCLGLKLRVRGGVL